MTVPSMLTIRSPVLIPARAAGPPVATFATSAPLGRLSPRLSAISGVTSCSLAPSHGPLDRGAAASGGSDHDAHHVRRDRKADALRAARARIDRGVDADEPAVEIDQRAAGIAGIDRGVGLDEELIVADADLGARQRPRRCRASRSGRRRTDRRSPAPGRRPADRRNWRSRAREISRSRPSSRSTVRSLCSSLSTISASNSRLSDERDFHFARAFDHVVVGDDEPGRIDDDAGAERPQHLLARHRAEELAEQRIVHERIAVLDHPRGIDVDHRRRRPLDHRRV